MSVPGDGKKCGGKCGLVKPLSEFNRHGDGHQSYCRECEREYRKERKASGVYDTEKRREQGRAEQKRQQSNPEARAKQRARNKLNHAVRKGRIQRPDHCERPDCGKKPEPKRNGRSGLHADHYQGYDGDNWKVVQWVCIECDTKIRSERGEWGKRGPAISPREQHRLPLREPGEGETANG